MPQSGIASMEAPRSRPVDSLRSERGLQDPVLGTTTPVDPSVPGGLVGVEGPSEESCTRRIGRQDVAKRSPGSSGLAGSRILQPPVPSGESNGRLETSNRPVSPQQVHQEDTIQDGYTKDGHGVLEGRGLYDICRPQGRLLPGTRPPVKQEVSPGEVGCPGVAIQGLVFRSFNSPPGIHESVHDGFRLGTRTENSIYQIPGRLATPFILKGRLETTRRGGSTFVQRPGHHGQLGEVTANPSQQDDVPGNSTRLLTSQGISVLRQTRQPGPGAPAPPSRTTQKSEGLAEVGRTPCVPGEAGSPRKTAPEGGSVEPKRTVESEQFLGLSSTGPSGDQTGLRMGAGSLTHPERDSTFQPTSGAPSLHGRIEGRVGSSPPGEDCKGNVDGRREVPPHQCPRNESSPGSLLPLRGGHEGELGSPNARQRNRGCIREEGGGTEAEGIVRSGSSNPKVGREGGRQPDGKVHSGEEERPSRRSQQGGSGSSDRVVPTPTSGKPHYPDVGVSGNGPSTSSNQPKDDFGSALVAREGLVRRPKEPRHSSSLASARQIRRTKTTSLSEVSRKPGVPSSTRLEVIQRLLKK
ncbi:collagen alpha-2(IX) chain-like [Palaemon carinicauda]|uniref:collagen alpha-2(IX) chain-like n=1 Tax=Palaemon carinicauda TaxID=392227 RepID=UPI0035B61E4C